MMKEAFRFRPWSVIHILAVPLHWTLLATVLMVTNSSAEEGWMPMVESKTSLVAPALSATAIPCMISGESGPTMCAPRTFLDAASTTSFISARSSRPESVFLIGLKPSTYLQSPTTHTHTHTHNFDVSHSPVHCRPLVKGKGRGKVGRQGAEKTRHTVCAYVHVDFSHVVLDGFVLGHADGGQGRLAEDC